jgi:hypothetical protein
MGIAKYPSVNSTPDLFELALAQDFIICEPFLPGVKKVKAICGRCNRPAELNIEKLRKNLLKRGCCDQFEKLKHSMPDFPPYPPYVESGSCSSCGSTALTDEQEVQVPDCPTCNPLSSLWAKGGTVSIYRSGANYIIDLSNGSGLVSDRLDPGSTMVFKAQIPPREPEAFIDAFQEAAQKYKWTKPTWYIADWSQGPKHIWRHLNWVIRAEEPILRTIVEFTLDKLSQDTKFQMKATQRRKKRAQKPTSALSKGNKFVIESGLPLKGVHYPPARLGMLFAFSDPSDSVPYLCSCSKAVLETLRDINNLPDLFSTIRQATPYVADSLIARAKSLSLDECEELFRDEICHACSKTFPSLMSSAYEHGSFTYRWLYWYEKQECFINGFDYPSYKPAKGRPLDEFTEHLEVVSALNTPSFEIEAHKKARDRISSLLHLLLKERFQIQSMGGSSHAEITILKMVKELLPDLKIVHHFRPDWLNGLEIDIWIPDLNIGIEYQGEQHYHPIEIWGGDVGLKDLQIRDARKKKLCKELGVKLIEIKYDQKISKDALKTLLAI